MSLERYLTLIGVRHWDEVKRSWLGHMGNLPSQISAPDPGLDRLPTLQTAKIQDKVPIQNIVGLRENALAEALYLYHKAAHAQLAVARLSSSGMTAWSMFNAYHSAFLNAKAVMALLGVLFPKVEGADWLIDIFPAPDKRRNNRQFKMKGDYTTIHGTKIPKLDQRYVWQALKRTCSSTLNAWTGVPAVEFMKNIDWERVTPPRNRFLYNPIFWPGLGDLSQDVVLEDWRGIIEPGLDPDSPGFLLSLSLDMFELSRWLFDDLGRESNLFAAQLMTLRWPDPELVESWGACAAHEARAAA